jgi:hypothetical protein
MTARFLTRALPSMRPAHHPCTRVSHAPPNWNQSATGCMQIAAFWGSLVDTSPEAKELHAVNLGILQWSWLLVCHEGRAHGVSPQVQHVDITAR